MDSTKLRHHAQIFFERKLFLMPEKKKSILSKGDGKAEEELVDLDVPKVKINKKTLIDNAKGILSNFPIEKSMFSPERRHLPTNSIFVEIQDPDKIINSLLFSTKLVFFDSSKTSSDIINEVSSDSFGYINILRENQISIMKAEILRLTKEKKFLDSDEIVYKLKRARTVRDLEIKERQEYLDRIVSFYADYVMNSDTEKNRAKILEWLTIKVNKNKRT